MLNFESKLNPLAEAFVPPPRSRLSAAAPEFHPSGDLLRAIASNPAPPSRFRSQPQSSRAGSVSFVRKDRRAEKEEREAKRKRTIYVGDIDPRITEEELAEEFSSCGKVKACLICGGSGNSRCGLRFGFLEFENEECARAAMGLNCTRIGNYPVRVSPSRTAISSPNHLS